MNPLGSLVVSIDDASWDGLSLTAVHIARELLDAAPAVVVWRRGRLDHHLEGGAEVIFVDDLDGRPLPRALESTPAARFGAWTKNRAVRRWLRRRGPVIGVLAVGIAAARAAAFLPPPRPPLLCVVRPEEALDPTSVAFARSLGATFIVGDEDRLSALRTIGVAKGDLLLEPQVTLPAPAAMRSSTSVARPRPRGGVEVAAVGTQDWWSDPDPFFLLAWTLVRATPHERPHLTWLAPLASADDLWPFEHDRRNCGLEGFVSVDSSATPVDTLDRADVLLVTGRAVDLHRSLVAEARRQGMPVLEVDDRTLDLGPTIEQVTTRFDRPPAWSRVPAPQRHALARLIDERLDRPGTRRS